MVGNIIKYLWRYEKKDGIQDVEKALWYLSRLHKELYEQKMQYKIVADENGIGLETPWHTLMVPREGDMFNQKSQARAGLLTSLLERGGYCPCQTTRDRDTMCPCKNYRTEGKCICGLFTKIPQNNDTGGNDNVETESVGTNTETKDSKE